MLDLYKYDLQNVMGPRPYQPHLLSCPWHQQILATVQQNMLAGEYISKINDLDYLEDILANGLL